MSAFKVYEDCTLCHGKGEYEGETDWGVEWITCIVCTERYIMELRTLLYQLLVTEIDNTLAEQIHDLLQDRPESASNKIDRLLR